MADLPAQFVYFSYDISKMNHLFMCRKNIPPPDFKCGIVILFELQDSGSQIEACGGGRISHRSNSLWFSWHSRWPNLLCSSNCRSVTSGLLHGCIYSFHNSCYFYKWYFPLQQFPKAGFWANSRGSNRDWLVCEPGQIHQVWFIVFLLWVSRVQVRLYT